MEMMYTTNMTWRKIHRDKDGFAETTCLDWMYQLLPIAVKKKGWNIIELATEENWGEMRGDIERHPCYEYYVVLPPLPYEEDENE